MIASLCARRIVVSLCTLALLGGVAAANNPPVVSNVYASQRPDGSKLVDIYYNLHDADGDACTVWARVSADGGATFNVPALSVTGHVGGGIAPAAGRHIIWDAGADIPGAVLNNCKVRVYADDGNGLAPMVLVPAGWFQMGDPWNEGQTDERPVHQVWLSTYRIDKYEVTNALYCQFLNNGGNDDHWDANQKILRVGVPGFYFYSPAPGFEDHPVVYVNWTDAMHFCDWRSVVEGLPVGTYRLPTEAQWEKAAGWDPTGAGRHWRFGERSDGCGTNCLDGHRANYSGSGDPFESGTTPVGYYNGSTYGSYTTQNAQSYYGCYDMSGNVWEWCYDWYSSTYYSSPQSNPQGPTSGLYRVLRGGSWNDSPTFCRSANRHGDAPTTYRDSRVGFRCSSGAP